MKMICLTSTSVSAPGRNGNILITLRSFRTVYFVTRPTGPESESSQTIAWRNFFFILYIGWQIKLQEMIIRFCLPSFLRIYPKWKEVLCSPVPVGVTNWHASWINVETFCLFPTSIKSYSETFFDYFDVLLLSDTIYTQTVCSVYRAEFVGNRWTNSLLENVNENSIMSLRIQIEPQAFDSSSSLTKKRISISKDT